MPAAPPDGTRRAASAPARRRDAQRADASARRPSRVREPVAELEQPAHLGAAEGVDGLVRVADDDEVAAVAGERLQQPLLRRVGVLVLVDDDQVVPRAQRLAPRRASRRAATARWTSSA